MPLTLNYYIDDSGTRHPDKNPGNRPSHDHDWFALGGVLIRSEDEAKARDLHRSFCNEWQINYPLHSNEIRGRARNFSWLKHKSEQERKTFFEAITKLVTRMPILGLACVIDRPGYNYRYDHVHNKKWLLYKTAFAISVERATKQALRESRKLRVFVERCNKRDDQLAMEYYDDLKKSGPPFARDTSQPYQPLSQSEFNRQLYEFRIKTKHSPLMQIADLCLWPICMGGYDSTNHSYVALRESGKLIECTLPEVKWRSDGTKYSCFGLERGKK